MNSTGNNNQLAVNNNYYRIYFKKNKMDELNTALMDELSLHCRYNIFHIVL